MRAQNWSLPAFQRQGLVLIALMGCAPSPAKPPRIPEAPEPSASDRPPGPFEGEITMAVTVGDVGTRVFTFQGTKRRLDFSGPHPGSILADAATSTVTILSPESRLATVEQAPQGAPGPEVTEAHAEGTDRVAGHPCETWKVTQSDGSVFDLCVAHDIPRLGVGQPAAWEARVPGFALRVRQVDVHGFERGHTDVTRIVEKAVPAATFEIPAGYQVAPKAR